MKTSTKAALLSAFVFPGAGQFYLKRHIMGIVFLTIALVAFVAMILPGVAPLTELMERAQSGELTAGPELVGEAQALATDLVSRAIVPASVAVATQVIATIHAWRVGKSANAGRTEA